MQYDTYSIGTPLSSILCPYALRPPETKRPFSSRGTRDFPPAPDASLGAGALWLKPEFRDELLEVPLAPVHHEGLPIPAHVEGIVHAVYERHDGLILAPDLRIGTDDSANLKDEDGCQGIAKGVPIVFRDERRRNRQHPRNDGPRLDKSTNCGPEGCGASSYL